MYTQARSGHIALAAAAMAAAAAGATGLYHAGKGLLGDDSWEFFKGMARNPSKVGALAPCSTYTAHEVTKHLTTASGNIRVLEVGGGTGQFTHKIESLLKAAVESKKIAGYTLDVVELDQQFCTSLEKKFSSNENFSLHCIDVTQFKPTEKYDFIISSVPFSNIPSAIVQEIINTYVRIIKPGGVISYIELTVSSLNNYFPNKAHRKNYQEGQAVLKEFRKKHTTETVKIWRNIPPVFVYHVTID